MSEIKQYTGKLVGLEMENDATGKPFIKLTIDEMVFRYFKGDANHKHETLEGLKRFISGPLTVKYTERKVEGRNFPYRNIMEFPPELEAAKRPDQVLPQKAGEARPKKPVYPDGFDELPTEETVSIDENDPDVQLYRRCIKLSLLAWQPQFNDWKAEGLKLTGDRLMKRIGETATSFYITKVKDR